MRNPRPFRIPVLPVRLSPQSVFSRGRRNAERSVWSFRRSSGMRCRVDGHSRLPAETSASCCGHARKHQWMLEFLVALTLPDIPSSREWRVMRLRTVRSGQPGRCRAQVIQAGRRKSQGPSSADGICRRAAWFGREARLNGSWFSIHSSRPGPGRNTRQIHRLRTDIGIARHRNGSLCAA
jgi:hypothetical protein